MLYKHWKKIVLALTGFFWASCDETASGPVTVNEDTPSSTISETEGTSSSSKAKSAASSAEETSAASSAEKAGKSSSSKAKSAASSAEETGSEEASAASSAEETSKSSSSKAKSAASSAESSSEASSEESSAENANGNTASPIDGSSSSSAKSSSSSKKHHRSSSSSLDEPVDLYGCPSDFCGPIISDTASNADPISVIAAKYGVILPESSSSSSISEIIAKYGVPSKTTCSTTDAKDGKVVYKCEDGVTCVEETTTEMQPPPCEGNVCPKYGVVKISKKTYTCDNGQVYNEAEFQMLYDTLPEIEGPIIKDSIQVPIALYGPPCVFDGTCDKKN